MGSSPSRSKEASSLTALSTCPNQVRSFCPTPPGSARRTCWRKTVSDSTAPAGVVPAPPTMTPSVDAGGARRARGPALPSQLQLQLPSQFIAASLQSRRICVVYSGQLAIEFASSCLQKFHRFSGDIQTFIACMNSIALVATYLAVRAPHK